MLKPLSIFFWGPFLIHWKNEHPHISHPTLTPCHLQSKHFGLQKRERCQQRVITDFLESDISTFHWLRFSLRLAGSHLRPSPASLCVCLTSHSHLCQGGLGGKPWKTGEGQPVTVVQDNAGRCPRPLLCAPSPEASRLQDKETTPLKRVFGSGDVIRLLWGTTVFRPHSKVPPSHPGVFGAGSQLKDLGLHLPVRLSATVSLQRLGGPFYLSAFLLPLTRSPSTGGLLSAPAAGVISHSPTILLPTSHRKAY